MDSKIIYFTDDELEGNSLPRKFTFPFFYEPHPLAVIAANGLRSRLEKDIAAGHNFGLDDSSNGMAIGKMFGVLVVKDREGRVGYLCGFSGKLAGSNEHALFVPPVFDMLTENSFFLKEQYTLNDINDRVTAIETDDRYIQLTTQHEALQAEADTAVEALRRELRENKAERKQLRISQKEILSPDDYREYEAWLIRYSLHDKHRLKVLEEKYAFLIGQVNDALGSYTDELERLKTTRREKSAALQQQLFEQYTFLNRFGTEKSLYDIFSATVFGRPPAAAGECATPKLLQYAFGNNYEPLAMAEFWWGASPPSEVRKHGHYYPACTGKCKPILEHMLDGMEIDENPLLVNPGEFLKIKTVYEDDSFIVVNKPSGLLSVPGIAIQDSVYTRLKYLWKDTEPLIIHRLDMATSGLLVVAKTPQAHKHIQRQFLKRTVVKRYVALLDGELILDEGEISLPLRVDLDDRPRQMVCFEHGKKAVTRWKKIEATDGRTKVHFWPLTGRTHQLRMHAAHAMGLGTPIMGDDLYGKAAERLYLHAAYLEFTHPVTDEMRKFEAPEEF